VHIYYIYPVRRTSSRASALSCLCLEAAAGRLLACSSWLHQVQPQMHQPNTVKGGRERGQRLFVALLLGLLVWTDPVPVVVPVPHSAPCAITQSIKSELHEGLSHVLACPPSGADASRFRLSFLRFDFDQCTCTPTPAGRPPHLATPWLLAAAAGYS